MLYQHYVESYITHTSNTEFCRTQQTNVMADSTYMYMFGQNCGCIYTWITLLRGAMSQLCRSGTVVLVVGNSVMHTIELKCSKSDLNPETFKFRPEYFDPIE